MYEPGDHDDSARAEWSLASLSVASCGTEAVVPAEVSVTW